MLFFFQTAAGRMTNSLSRSLVDVDQFRALAKKANDVVIANIKKDEDFDDAPDEFIGEFQDRVFHENVSFFW